MIPALGMSDLLEHFPVLDMSVGEDFFHRVYWASWQPGIQQNLQPFLPCLLGKGLLEYWYQLVPILHVGRVLLRTLAHQRDLASQLSQRILGIVCRCRLRS